ncbi:DUF2887 domain-containing protein [Nostoc sp. FACHB-280]|uniref:DUF2887 domain-containing protein n=1 Tax=Nostoc sp. FACHB-280 TaxID=2692839 RepID=UPI00168B6EED|nr:DUF2887 domain-containing protein [Nostoc sp. FACHB-280]
MRRDAIFYKLFQQFPPLLFELLKHSPNNAQNYLFDSLKKKCRLVGAIAKPNKSLYVLSFILQPNLY